MRRQLLPILALLAGSAFLMIAGGLNGLILPLRGTLEGFSTTALGLLGAGWAIGYIAGCIWTPRLVKRSGHVRTIAVLAALAVLSVLVSLLLIQPAAWIVLRALAGFAFAGAAMIVESWLSEHAEARYRGRIFSVYTMVNLFATTAGQMLLTLGDASGHIFFVLAAIFYSLSLVPTALTRTEQPRPLVESSLDLPALIRNSPLAAAGAFLIGVSNSTFGSLGVVFGGKIGLETSQIAVMMSLSLLAGSAVQPVVGLLSDRMDRRVVLVGLALVASAVDVFFLAFAPAGAMPVLVASAIFGGSIYAMYPVVVAHAYDHARPEQFLKISGGLLLVFGIGSIAGPLAGGVIMAWSPQGLFAATLAAHAALAVYGIWRIRRRAPVAEEEKAEFVGIPSARLTTPEAAAFDPRADNSGGPVEQREGAASNEAAKDE
jgi:MFS family permease